MALAAFSASSSGTPAMTTSAPPAFMKVRRLMCLSLIVLIVPSSGHRPGGALNGGDDAHVGSAAAEMRRRRSVGECAPDLSLVGGGRPREQVNRHDHHSVLAVAALGNLLVDPGLLDWMQGLGRLGCRKALLLGPARRETLEGRHVVLDGRPGSDTGAGLLVSDKYGAGATLTQAATELRAPQAQLISQHVEQGRVGRRLNTMVDPVDPDRALRYRLLTPDQLGCPNRDACSHHRRGADPAGDPGATRAIHRRDWVGSVRRLYGRPLSLVIHETTSTSGFASQRLGSDGPKKPRSSLGVASPLGRRGQLDYRAAGDPGGARFRRRS